MPSLRHHRVVMRRHGVAIAAAGMFALTLSGCTGAPESTPTPSAPASADPVFASDEEALAAAVAAYEEYRAASAAVSMDGGADADRVLPYVSERFAPQVLEEFSALQTAGLRLVGSISVDTTSLAGWSALDGSAEVSIYLCRDVSGARAVNVNGDDVTPDDRDDRVPLQAHLISDTSDPRLLVVDGVEQWSGDDFC
ncbi:hypothetical protein [Agromyces sp. H66]|uniref:hypothetical protein n=1 Tax=Agromyces sp. H66 TaxID=2529859 RepID=UPI0010AAE7A8|nr:hypothetical protein [Agromyces sp. H66]